MFHSASIFTGLHVFQVLIIRIHGVDQNCQYFQGTYMYTYMYMYSVGQRESEITFHTCSPAQPKCVNIK